MLRTTDLMSIFATFHPVIDGPCSGYRVVEFPPQMEMGELAPGKPISTAECLSWGYESLGSATVLVYETEEKAALAIAAGKVSRLWELACDPRERARVVAETEAARLGIREVIAYSA